MKRRYLLLFMLIIPISELTAQTGGPGQPEFMQFQQAGTDNMVDLSTGSFSYQIPLFSIGGYPMNLTYQSGIQMEDVSSMVGLGWNLNAGSIVRTLRGLPDDFKGDEIVKEFSMKPNETHGGRLGGDVELVGLPIGLSLGGDFGIFYNNYKGWGMEFASRVNISGAVFGANKSLGGTASLGLGVSANSQSGVDKYISPGFSFRFGVDKKKDFYSLSLRNTMSVNSKEGLSNSFNVGLSYNRYVTKTKVNKETGESITKSGISSLPLLGYSIRSYVNNSFNPDIDYPFENKSGTFSGAIGWSGIYVNPDIRLSAYFSIQKLSKNIQKFAALGSMYEDNTSISENTLMDFSREKRLPYFFGESEILPVPYKTPDIFNLNAQGLSMTFSVSKKDIGIVGDPTIQNEASNTQAGIEANLGNLFKAGANYGNTTTEQYSKRWAPPPVTFKAGQDVINNNLYRQFNLKNHGEINKFSSSIFNHLGGYSPVRNNLLNEKNIHFTLSNGMALQNFVNLDPQVFQSTINYLTAEEAGKMGFDKKLNFYTFAASNTLQNIDRTSGFRQKHHLSEISVTQPDGMKYIFGIPVYNTEQKEVTFTVGQVGLAQDDKLKNLVSYSPSSENSIQNDKGIDNFFESTSTPAYVTQFLITAVLSPDYRDITGDGISSDDLGNYVKFSYYKEDFLYKWRNPFEQNKANYNRGLRSDPTDDKGSYIYGEKELLYVKSMESKTEVAEFYYSKRKDAHGVNGENGGLNPQTYLRKIDSIKVYSLPDRRNSPNTSIPVKSIYFYNDDYTLCRQTNNSVSPTKGKLTLKKVVITYENSKKGFHTPYEFEYGKEPSGSIVNPVYNQRNVNRWGYYQENLNYSDCDDNSPLSNIDFPYSSQDKTVMDRNAYAWNLTGITIPGGGKIEIKYEANDYAYIQDRTAGQMFKVTGIENPGVNTLSSGNKIYFKVTPGTSYDDLEKKYIRDIKDKFLYYKFYVDMKNGKYEYVSGYSKISGYGLAGSNQAYIELNSAIVDDEHPTGSECNPVRKLAIQNLRINNNQLIFSNTGTPPPASLSSFALSLPDVFSDLSVQIQAATTGMNQYCILQGYCNTVDLNKSFIRLYNPDGMKISGGCRVKEVFISDEFASMTGNIHPDKSYTTSYYYTTTAKDPVTDQDILISSGVADYEPLAGGDEISLKQPFLYRDKKKFATDNEFYVETPVNESLFPSPQIIYSKVTQVTNKTAENVGKTGKIENEFYTAKDFPVIVNMTDIDPKRDKTNYNMVQVPIVSIEQQHDFATVSQGYSIILNNMSGVPRATWVYNEGGKIISGEKMEYFSDNEDLTTIDKYGNIHTDSRLGITVDYTIDGRKNYEKSTTNIVQANYNTALIPIPLPVPIPLGLPQYTRVTEERQFQSIVINKEIHRNGILKKKTVYDQTSQVTTENLAFDEITGDVLLTRTTNEFNDYLYSFKYPAYWMHEGMGPSYANTKLKLTSSIFNQFLKAGDELRDINGSRLWVTNTGLFVDADNNTVTALPNADFQVYSSGAKNLLNDKSGKVLTWNYNPLSPGNGNKINFQDIINSNAVEYFQDAVIHCEACTTLASISLKNDFLSGKKGNWKPLKTWFHLTDRDNASNITTGITNIRTEGKFISPAKFWSPVNTFWYKTPFNWEWKEQVNMKDVEGNVLETVDRLYRKNSSLLGYNNTLITAQAVNSGYLESFYDGFEDYRISRCYPQGTNTYLLKRFNNPLITISGNESHTGKYSLEVSSTPVILSAGLEPLCADTGSTETGCFSFKPCNLQKYLFSCWVKVNKTQPVLSNNDAKVDIDNLELRPEGPVIEGWQRVMGTFTASGNTLTIKLSKGTATTYYDDIRIIRNDGNMISYVYDDINYRLTNILDENNYFTKYEYNNDGYLIRIKKETEKGIITVQEGYQSLRK